VSKVLKTLTAERTENAKALSALNGTGKAQGLGLTEQVYCPVHGTVKGIWGQCEECFDAGLQDFDATRVAKLLIPSWVGLDVTNRKVFVARVCDAVEAIEKISLYKNSDALVLLVWGTLVTPLDSGKIGLSWTLGEVSEILDVECVTCGQPFTPIADERVCESCALGEAH
jgi:hypothetical protein